MINLTIGIYGALTVREGDMIASRVEETLINSIPNIGRVHVHYHPAEEKNADMTIDEILEQSKRRTFPYQPK